MDVILDSRRGSHGPGDSGPDLVLLAGGPGKTPTRLVRESRELVAKELQPQNEVKPVFHDRDVVLNESTQEVERSFRIRKGQRVRIERRAVHERETIVRSPHEVVPRERIETVLEIEVEGLCLRIHEPRGSHIREVVVKTRGQTGYLGKSPLPVGLEEAAGRDGAFGVNSGERGGREVDKDA